MPTKLEIVQRRRKVAERLLQGRLPEEIAEELGLTTARLRLDLREIRKQWAADVERPRREHLIEQVARMAVVERHAWNEWTRSLEERKKTGTSKKTDADGEVATQVSTNATIGLGEPTYLKLVFDCVDRRAKWLGLNSEVVEEKPPLEETPEFQEFVRQLPAEQLELLTQALKVLEGVGRGSNRP